MRCLIALAAFACTTGGGGGDEIESDAGGLPPRVCGVGGDASCEPGEVCTDSRCAWSFDPGETPCASDGDCDGGYCYEGACETCRRTMVCPAGRTCVDNGRCELLDCPATCQQVGWACEVTHAEGQPYAGITEYRDADCCGAPRADGLDPHPVNECACDCAQRGREDVGNWDDVEPEDCATSCTTVVMEDGEEGCQLCDTDSCAAPDGARDGWCANWSRYGQACSPGAMPGTCCGLTPCQCQRVASGLPTGCNSGG